MTDIIMIPLTKLVESEDNVRGANRKAGIAELAACVKAIGLLQSIVVKDAGNGRFAVIAGARRPRALRLLAKAGDIEKNASIPCRVISGDDNAAELSLAENVSRVDLLPWEELDAYKQHIDSGEGPETIAARFCVACGELQYSVESAGELKHGCDIRRAVDQRQERFLRGLRQIKQNDVGPHFKRRGSQSLNEARMIAPDCADTFEPAHSLKAGAARESPTRVAKALFVIRAFSCRTSSIRQSFSSTRIIPRHLHRTFSNRTLGKG